MTIQSEPARRAAAPLQSSKQVWMSLSNQAGHISKQVSTPSLFGIVAASHMNSWSLDLKGPTWKRLFGSRLVVRDLLPRTMP
ncbi:hypothetical protein PT974_06106 [Cladobotryum mycophilum]|uniref:Uncharacterized protein n=1 Tax=Cladobotryum mycophilum TaxID=491253 RepID=A0ABR0SLU7_9HYPO